jgi:phospholipid/cholesterol/gamma-HCH transport system ATP-binding protein
VPAASDAHQTSSDIIVVEGLTCGYSERTILEDVSFCVREREALAVLGPSGCGKTTLLKALTGLLVPSRGRIRIAGETITGENAEQALSRVRRRIGVLFQSGALLDSLTVAENVSLPLSELAALPADLVDGIVGLKLDLVKLGQHVHLLPSELSGGMRKRAGLARAMALDPEILFCDEPSAGLDPATAAEVDGLLVQLNTHLGITVVLITHELASVENVATRCLMLDEEAKGIIAAGSVDNLKASGDSRVRRFFRRELPATVGPEHA